MIIAQEKRKTNIAEYIIYMWHIEDLVRACNFDIKLIENKIIDGFNASPEVKKEIVSWYENILLHMVQDKVQEKGHMHVLNNLVSDLNDFHLQLLNHPSQGLYRQLYAFAKPNLDIFKAKSDGFQLNDIELCLQALYSLLLMKMSGKNISPGTMESMETFSKLMSYLALKHKEFEEGKLNIFDND